MRIILSTLLLCLLLKVSGQQPCGSFDYAQRMLQSDAGLSDNIDRIEQFIRGRQDVASREMGLPVIKIPVVVHILYNNASQQLPDAVINSQLEMLNNCFRHRNADSVKTPAAFKALAADCEIEFQLAVSDPRRRRTTGIVRKYTSVSIWETNDNMKYSANGGDDAWDPANYFNIWVCNVRSVNGYSSVLGADPGKEGIVISFGAFGGKTAVHEAGHWLGLKHIWGDANCGDDAIDDTPVQSTYTPGCPSGTRLSIYCSGNGPAGDMYMNYMDYTADACTNLFTWGQKTRMRSLFATGGYRASLLSTYAFDRPLIDEAPLPDDTIPVTPPKPTDLISTRLYPNPTSGNLWLDVSSDLRWIGKPITIYNMQGQPVQQIVVNSKLQELPTGKLLPGMYLLVGRDETGEAIRQKFIKR